MKTIKIILIVLGVLFAIFLLRTCYQAHLELEEINRFGMIVLNLPRKIASVIL